MVNDKELKAIQKKFRERIREERTKLGISQEELGLRTGLDRTYISGIERGLHNPSLKNILKISNALSIDPRNFYAF